MSMTWDDNTAEFYGAIEKAADAGLNATTLALAGQMKRSMPKGEMEAGTGGWKNPRLTPSLPGMPPNQQTGGLFRSIISGKIRRLVYAAGTSAGKALTEDEKYNYGLLLERGTSTMVARPWALPAVNNNKPLLMREFNKGFQRSFKKAGSS